MGYRLTPGAYNKVLGTLGETYRLYAPRRYRLEGEFSDTDSIRYGEVISLEEMELGEKSSHSFKEALTPISETLFYFTENEVKDADIPAAKPAILFLRACDVHALSRQDDMYLKNGAVVDPYYARLRENIKVVLIGCNHAFDNCFCVDMGTNIAEHYDASLDLRDGVCYIDVKNADWDELFRCVAENAEEVVPAHVTQTEVHVNIPDKLTAEVTRSKIWDEYDTRCIACGRCNFSCPTCTCYTMQDIFYTDNGKVGERRRVWAGCMVDGFTDVAGGGSYRQKYGERMRFKVLHKVLDYKQRFGYHMCVGCGRCDDVCPEYISFSAAVNKLEDALQEVSDDAK